MTGQMRLLLVIVLSVGTVAHAYDNRSEAQRKADEARQRMVEKAQKDRKAKESVKRQAAEAAETAKQQEVRAKHDAEQRARRKRLYDEAPKEFFAKYVENKLLVTEYGLDEPPTLSVRIIQIPSDRLLIVEVVGTDQWVALEGYKTGGLVDDMSVKLPVKDGGTYRYTSVLGAVKTIPRYVPPVTLTYEGFEALKAKGIDVLDAVEGYLYRNKLTWQ